MSYNGSGTFNINTTGQPVVAGTVISSSAFNSLTNDLATGLTTAITKDGQTTTTARITFAQGLTSSLVTDSSSTTTGSIITAGGAGIAKNVYVGGNANVAGTLDVTGGITTTNPTINNIKMGYTTTATAAGTTTLTVSSNYRQFFTGTLAQTIILPVTSTLVTGIAYEIENNSTGLLTVNSSGGNLVGTIPAGVCAHAVCIGTTLTTAADWDWDYISTSTITGTGANVLGTSPTITSPTLVTPALGTPASGVMTNVTGINYDGYKNRIINGAMVIDQRNAGNSLSVANTGVYSLDRWRISNSVSTITVQQSSSVIPTGFGNSLGLAVSTTDNTGSHAIQQFIEGFNTADLGFGTANAVTFTLSFWVRSSLTGLYGVGFQNSAQSRSYVGTYTINSANTWEQKSITVAGDTSGTWIGATNGIGLSLEFDLGSASSYNQTAGSWGTVSNARRTSSCVNWANTASATFYITGVQLEKGSTATSFDYRPYGTELGLCQRYFCSSFNIGTAPAQNLGGGMIGKGSTSSTTEPILTWQLPVSMRIAPTVTTYNPSAANAQWSSGTTPRVVASQTAFVSIDNTGNQTTAASQSYIHASGTSEL